MHNGGQWTPARFHSFIKGALRSASLKWPPRYTCLNNAYVGVQVNEKTGRKAKHYKCNHCEKEFPLKDVEVNHKESVVPPEGFTTWDEIISRMFREIEFLEVLCKACHTKYTRKEREISNMIKSIRKNYPREECVYRNMISRCHNQNATGYKYYGGRGIVVCDSWRESFMNFFEDMGPRPEGATLDRIDYNKGYCKDNCRWATRKEQGNNKSDNVLIDYAGEIKTLSEWADTVGVKQNTLLYRIKRGWTIPEALGMVERTKKDYYGRLSLDDIAYLIEEIDSGRTQTSVGQELEMDSSQISRIYNKFKTNAEKRQAKERRTNERV